LSTLLRRLGAHGRLAAAGGAVVVGSLLLPWYGVTFAGGLYKTPLGAFGWVEAALLLTLGATAWLLFRFASGRRLPRPLHIGTLVAAAGAWTLLLIVYRIIDRPDFGPIGASAGLRYGIFVGLGGAVVLVLGGLRLRREELGEERARERDRGDPLRESTQAQEATETFTSPRV
jgi:hypothetical protein